MLNQTVMIGRITKDPELRKTQTGISLVSFSLACEREKTKDQQPETDFFNCKAWRHTADYMTNYVKKGTLLSVIGRFQNRSYEDKEGKKVYITELICETVDIISKPRTNKENCNTEEVYEGLK